MKNYFIFFILFLLTGCNNIDVDVKSISGEIETDSIKLQKYNVEYRGMGVKYGFDFFRNNDTVSLYYYSILCDSIYIYNVDGDITNYQSFKMINNDDTTKVLSIKVISADSIIVLKEQSLSIIDIQKNKLLFNHKFSPNISVLSNFKQPQLNKKRDKIYCELIQWTAPLLKSGVINTDLIYEISIKENKGRPIALKFPEEVGYPDPNFSFYFTINNNRIIQSYSNSGTVDIVNLESERISKKNLLSPILNQKRFKSNIKSVVDRAGVERLSNSYFDDILSDSSNNIYRIQTLPLNRRTKSGYLSSFNQKEFRILKYDSSLNLIKILYSNYRGVTPRYFFLNKGEIYCLKHNLSGIIIIKIVYNE